MKAIDFLSSSKNDLSEAARSEGDIPAFVNMRKYVSQSVKDKSRERLDGVIDGYVTDNLYNSFYKDAWSYSITRALENVWNALFDANRESLRQIEEKDSSAYWDLMSWSAQSHAKMLKTVQKFKDIVPVEMTNFLTDLQTIKSDQAKIKAVLKSGKKPAEPKPGAFVKPMASREATKKAKRIADEAVAMFRQELIESTKTVFLNAFERITRPGLTYEEIQTMFKEGGMNGYMVQRFIRPIRAKKTFEYLNDANKGTVINLAIRQADDVIESFTAKTTSKLALIFEKKAEIAEYKVTRSVVNQGMVDATMFVKFNDASRFTIYSQVEFSYSVHGKLFMRYPTRFTDVYFADGSKMTNPSEEKMIKTF